MNTAYDLWGKTNRFLHFCLLLFVIIPLFMLPGCAAFGPRRVPADRFNYNEAVARSTREQMLLNLVRRRYLQVPVFLTVSSVLTQYVYEGRVGVSGSLNLGGSDTVGGTGNLGYSERPTITYLPIEGQAFAAQMLSDIPSEIFFAASQAGWPSDIFMKIGMQRIGAAENMSFGSIPAPGNIDQEEQFKRDFERLKRFQRVVDLLMVLGNREAVEVHLVQKDGIDERYLIFEEKAPKDLLSRIREIKALLGLSPARNIFRITKRFTRLRDDEISIQTRSVMAMIGFMSKGIEVPPEHLAEGRVIDFRFPKGEENPIPFTMHWSKKRPENPFATIRYQDYWFYIDNADIRSKRALNLILILFRLQAPTPAGAAPVLTLPAG